MKRRVIKKNPKRDINYYMGIDYAVRVVDLDNGLYMATIPCLPGCSVTAKTIDELPYLIIGAKYAWLKEELKNNRTIPLYDSAYAEGETEWDDFLIECLIERRFRAVLEEDNECTDYDGCYTDDKPIKTKYKVISAIVAVLVYVYFALWPNYSIGDSVLYSKSGSESDIVVGTVIGTYLGNTVIFPTVKYLIRGEDNEVTVTPKYSIFGQSIKERDN